MELAYSEHDRTELFARYNWVLIKNEFVKYYKNSCRLTLFFINFLTEKKRSWLIYIELSYCLYLVFLFFGEDSRPKKHRHMHSWIQKMFDVFLYTQKSLSILGLVRLDILHTRHYHRRFHHFFISFILNFSCNIFLSKYLVCNNTGVNIYIVFKCFSIYFQIFQVVVFFSLKDLPLLRNVKSSLSEAAGKAS